MIILKEIPGTVVCECDNRNKRKKDIGPNKKKWAFLFLVLSLKESEQNVCIMKLISEKNQERKNSYSKAAILMLPLLKVAMIRTRKYFFCVEWLILFSVSYRSSFNRLIYIYYFIVIYNKQNKKNLIFSDSDCHNYKMLQM